MKNDEHANATRRGTAALAALWSRRCSICGTYQRPLTRKEWGQLKQLERYLGAQTHAVMEYALSDWQRFGARAAADAGTSFPGNPHIGFLLRHHAVAVQLMQQARSTAARSSVQDDMAAIVPRVPRFTGQVGTRRRTV